MPKITGNCGGSFLMKGQYLLHQVVAAVVQAAENCGVPVGVKFARAGTSKAATGATVQRLALTLEPRQ